MAEELAKLILDILKETDYRLITKARMKTLWLPNTSELAGLYTFEKTPPTIYIRKDLTYSEMHHIQLHELAHAYFRSIGKPHATEKDVEVLSYSWQKKIDGVM